MEEQIMRRACNAIARVNGYSRRTGVHDVPLRFNDVFVVHDKIFLTKDAAEDWQRETKDGMNYPLEKITFSEAIKHIQEHGNYDD